MKSKGGKETFVSKVDYTKNKIPFPESITFNITTRGRMTAIIWVRELLHNDLLISSRETASLVRTPLWLEQGDQCTATLDTLWQQTNAISVIKHPEDIA